MTDNPAARPSYKSCVLFVENVARSKAFYCQLLGQEIEEDFNRYVGFKGGFGIWDGSYALELIDRKKADCPRFGAENGELYFETADLDSVIRKLKSRDVCFIHDVMEHAWGQRGVRIADPDGHIIEISEPMEAVVRRLHEQGMDFPAIAKKTQFSIEAVREITRT